MKTAFKIAIVTISLVAGAGYNYDDLGDNWPDIKFKKRDGPNLCGTGQNQSPIDLQSRNNRDFKHGQGKDTEYLYKMFDGHSDQFTKIYENPFQAKPVWNGHTVQLDFAKTVEGPMMFTSNIAEQVFGANKEFNGAQFHFHAQSEHTIDGKNTDFEMHTVHLAKETRNGFAYAAVGIMFSINDYNAKLSWAEQKIIDNFFENLELDKEDPVVDWTLYGDLLSLVNTDNRWVYRGSVTTPPCAENVYWNVLTTVYPIKEKYVELFKSKLRAAGIQENRRRTQTITKSHNVIYLENDMEREMSMADRGRSRALVGIILVFTFFLVLLCTAVIYLGMKLRK